MSKRHKLQPGDPLEQVRSAVRALSDIPPPAFIDTMIKYISLGNNSQTILKNLMSTIIAVTDDRNDLMRPLIKLLHGHMIQKNKGHATIILDMDQYKTDLPSQIIQLITNLKNKLIGINYALNDESITVIAFGTPKALSDTTILDFIAHGINIQFTFENNDHWIEMKTIDEIHDPLIILITSNNLYLCSQRLQKQGKRVIFVNSNDITGEYEKFITEGAFAVWKNTEFMRIPPNNPAS